MTAPDRTAGADATATGLAFVKGHGTENDFVLLPDADGALTLTAELARALCDRRRGPGGDGAIRVARDPRGSWWMDYRNADGSPAEMCGNGARVFARFLVDAGWAPAGRLEFVTAGVTRVADLAADGDVTVAMGPVTLGATSWTEVAGRRFTGTAVDVGNPHLVCPVEDDAVLDALDLTRQPAYDPAVFPDGVNLEFVHATSPTAVRMRVHERGSGETRSCGTGTVAVAAVCTTAAASPTAAPGGPVTDGAVAVTVPGGTVQVRLAGGSAWLTGPAELSYSGTLNPAVFGAVGATGG